ncbi:hypothetical protein BS47DRAFT_1370284 [Hydnum rufescens UP504]|uniref:NADP-dependent oxidoreductase domain-containing protein n=1 Tax=Hydnum rufescens UP504 TaxID=1448309 RepID=A0A9P6BAE7_9AGAM|nr:hypothetical protein BS47DRAFT_1370284 [Hydnum rufescens UP504]
MISLDATQPIYDVPDSSRVPDDVQDAPVAGSHLAQIHSGIPPLLFGAAALSEYYNGDDHLRSDIPFRTVRLALRYGINGFDTSPYYGASELVLGSILRALAPEYPRSSYQIMSKCGRYGREKKDFDYSPATLRKSLARTLERLGTSYLDTLYLHDVEFVASPVHPSDLLGDPIAAIETEHGRAAWGLRPEDAEKVHGDGDEQILTAFGYPLPILLRLAVLIRARFAEPVDVVLSYSHYTLQNDAFAAYVPHFTSPSGAHVGQLFCASPLSMGFFSPNVPSWSPVTPGMREARARAIQICETANWPGGLTNLALGFGLRRSEGGGIPAHVPTVIGLSRLEEVHESVKIWGQVNGPWAQRSDAEARQALENQVRDCFVQSGWFNWSWASPSE